jgi:hypothetical protein
LHSGIKLTTELAAGEKEKSISEGDTVGLWWSEEAPVVLRD